jgi:hypothetical protein
MISYFKNTSVHFCLDTLQRRNLQEITAEVIKILKEEYIKVNTVPPKT